MTAFDIPALARIAAIRARFEPARTPAVTPGASGVAPTPSSGPGVAFSAALEQARGAVLDWSWAGDDLPPGTPYAELFIEAGRRHGISPRLLASVAQVESAFDPTAVSRAGAQGLMQFMPGTAAAMGVDPWDPASAIDGAARLLVGHQQRFGTIDAALAAYNAGGGTVARHGGAVPPTIQPYVDKVLALFRGGGS